MRAGKRFSAFFFHNRGDRWDVLCRAVFRGVFTSYYIGMGLCSYGSILRCFYFVLYSDGLYTYGCFFAVFSLRTELRAAALVSLTRTVPIGKSSASGRVGMIVR